MNIASTTEPKSDQQNYDDYIGGPKTVTVSEVKAGSAEQPVEVHLVEFPGRPFKPSKSMRRVLVTCWGSDSTAYTGRKMTLFGDPDVKFGGQKVGGIRIGALSNIEKPVEVSLTVTRGKRALFTVQPLAGAPKPRDTSGRDWLTELADAAQIDKEAVGVLGAAAKAASAGPVIVGLISKAWHELAEAEKAGANSGAGESGQVQAVQPAIVEADPTEPAEPVKSWPVATIPSAPADDEPPFGGDAA